MIAFFQLFILIALSLVLYGNAYMIGVDLGSEYFKICLIKPGKPFTIVENLQSKLKTPTAIALKDDEITYDAEALNKKARFPKNIFTYFEDFLGEKYNSSYVNRIMKEFLVSYEIQEDKERQSINFNIQFNRHNEILSIEEIYALLFNHIKFLSQHFGEIDITDIYLTIPSFYTYKQREAIAQAIQMSELRLDGFISDNLAAAVKYQFKKVFEKEEYFIFYNMGGSYTQASLVSFKTVYDTFLNKTVDVGNQVRVIGETWNKELGGHRFDKTLVELMMKKFDALPERKGKPSVMNNKKVFEKLIPYSIKYKEVLSANKEVHIAVLGVESGMNLEGMITRDEFIEANKHLLIQVYEPISKLLNDSGLTLANISQIELLGGSIRIPAVQDELKAKMGEYENLLGIHMNGDDSMAYGSAYVAANSTKNFKGARRAFMTIGSNSEIKMYLNNYNVNNDTVYCKEEDSLKNSTLNLTCQHRLNKSRIIFPMRSPYGGKKTAKIPHDGDISITLTERMVNEKEETELMTYYITGVKELLQKMNKENINVIPNIKIEFAYSKGGQITIEAFLEYEEELYLNLIINEKGKEELRYIKNYTAILSQEEIKKIDDFINTTKVVTDYEYYQMMKSNQTNQTINTTNVISESEKMFLINKKRIGEKKNHTVHLPLRSIVEHSYPKPLNTSQIEHHKQHIKHLLEIDHDRIKVIERKNTIESFIYNKKEWLQTEDATTYTKNDELPSIQSFIENISTWYEDEGFAANLTTLEHEIDIMYDFFRVYERRQRIDKERTIEITNFIEELNITNYTASALVLQDSWRFEYYNTTFQKEINEIHKWFIDSTEKQNNKTVFDEPYLTAEHIREKIWLMKNSLQRFKMAPKPLPVEQRIVNELRREGINLYDIRYRANNFTKDDWIKIGETINNKTSINTTKTHTEDL